MYKIWAKSLNVLPTYGFGKWGCFLAHPVDIFHRCFSFHKQYYDVLWFCSLFACWTTKSAILLFEPLVNAPLSCKITKIVMSTINILRTPLSHVQPALMVETSYVLTENMTAGLQCWNAMISTWRWFNFGHIRAKANWTQSLKKTSPPRHY